MQSELSLQPEFKTVSSLKIKRLRKTKTENILKFLLLK